MKLLLFENYIELQSKWDSLWEKIAQVNPYMFQKLLRKYKIDVKELKECLKTLNPKKVTEIIQELMYQVDSTPTTKYIEKPNSDGEYVEGI